MEQQVHDFIESLPHAVQLVLMILGTLVVVATAYIKATPTEDDDKWFAKLEAIPVLGPVLQFIGRFSVVTRKEKELPK
jgi:hypothetical protein